MLLMVILYLFKPSKISKYTWGDIVTTFSSMFLLGFFVPWSAVCHLFPDLTKTFLFPEAENIQNSHVFIESILDAICTSVHGYGLVSSSESNSLLSMS